MCVMLLDLQKSVSVPLRGNGYRKYCFTKDLKSLFLKFPSPCGVMVIGNQDWSRYAIGHEGWFPSPCGVMVIGNMFDPLSN